MTIEHLPGTKLTPTVVLARQLEDASGMRGVIVLIQEADGRWIMDWSRLPVEQIAMASVYMQARAQKMVMGGDDDAEIVSGQAP